MTKVRAISSNAIALGSSRNRKRDLPVIGWVYHVFTKFTSWVLHYFRRRKNTVRMEALDRASWYDCDTRLFEAGFQILVEYVEGELAWMQILNEGRDKWYHRWTSVPNARERGLTMLAWEIQLGDDSITQSESARELTELYLWYKDERPNRVDPFSILTDIRLGQDLTTEENDALADAFAAEEAYEVEDTDMLVRLMKIRRSMWT